MQSGRYTITAGGGMFCFMITAQLSRERSARRYTGQYFCGKSLDEICVPLPRVHFLPFSAEWVPADGRTNIRRSCQKTGSNSTLRRTPGFRRWYTATRYVSELAQIWRENKQKWYSRGFSESFLLRGVFARRPN